MSQSSKLSRDQVREALTNQTPIYRNGHEFVISAVYYSEDGTEPKWLVDYIKISSKLQRIRTQDLISFCRHFSLTKAH